MIPLAYLNSPIFRELLLMAEEEFGFTRCGPLKVPCEAFVMEYIISLLNRNPPIEVASLPSPALLQTALIIAFTQAFEFEVARC
ncbi:hypothetical protein AMTRI_Chr05g63210 [Amborella trichopoda]